MQENQQIALANQQRYTHDHVQSGLLKLRKQEENDLRNEISKQQNDFYLNQGGYQGGGGQGGGGQGGGGQGGGQADVNYARRYVTNSNDSIYLCYCNILCFVGNISRTEDKLKCIRQK